MLCRVLCTIAKLAKTGVEHGPVPPLRLSFSYDRKTRATGVGRRADVGRSRRPFSPLSPLFLSILASTGDHYPSLPGSRAFVTRFLLSKAGASREHYRIAFRAIICF